MRLGRIQEKSKPHRRRGPQPLKPAFAFSAQPNIKNPRPEIFPIRSAYFTTKVKKFGKLCTFPFSVVVNEIK